MQINPLKCNLATATISLEEGVMAKATEKQMEWKRNNVKSYAIRCSRVSEKDLIEWMDKHKPSNAYIKGLIRADMERHKD